MLPALTSYLTGYSSVPNSLFYLKTDLGKSCHLPSLAINYSDSIYQVSYFGVIIVSPTSFILSY